MTAVLHHASLEHHDRLDRNLDQMPAVGDKIGTVPAAELSLAVDGICRFLSDLLLPHMAAAEQTLYPQLERLLQNRHSMTPMRREHEEIRGLIADLEQRRVNLHAGHLPVGDAVALRRLWFRLYALLKVHLAEELLYERMIEHEVSDAVGQDLANAMEHAEIQRL